MDSYAEQIIAQDADGAWTPAPGFEGTAWDDGLIRILQEDLGADEVRVLVFDPNRVLMAEASFSYLSPALVARTIREIR